MLLDLKIKCFGVLVYFHRSLIRRKKQGLGSFAIVFRFRVTSDLHDHRTGNSSEPKVVRTVLSISNLCKALWTAVPLRGIGREINQAGWNGLAFEGNLTTYGRAFYTASATTNAEAKEYD